jgi:hypothetical protein
MMDGVAHELTLPDVENDPNLIKKSTCIVTSNVDRAIINTEACPRPIGPIYVVGPRTLKKEKKK